MDHEKHVLKLHSPNNFQQRTRLVHDTLHSGHDSGKVEALRHWNQELFAIYDSDGQHIMDMVGSGLPFFGIIVFGVHMIAHTKTEDGLKYWVPRRSKTKTSCPGQLDNTVGGSLASGEKPVNCITRESAEEASLPENYTCTILKPCGALSYQMSRIDRCARHILKLYPCRAETCEEATREKGFGFPTIFDRIGRGAQSSLMHVLHCMAIYISSAVCSLAATIYA